MNLFISLIVLILSFSALSEDCLDKVKTFALNPKKLISEFCAEVEKATVDFSKLNANFCIELTPAEIDDVQTNKENLDDCVDVEKIKLKNALSRSINKQENIAKNQSMKPKEDELICHSQEFAKCEGLSGLPKVASLSDLIHDNKVKTFPTKTNFLSKEGCLECAEKAFKTEKTDMDKGYSEKLISKLNSKILSDMEDYIINSYNLLLEDEYLSGNKSQCDLKDINRSLEDALPEKMNKHNKHISDLLEKREVEITTCKDGRIITLKDFKKLKSLETKPESEKLLSLFQEINSEISVIKEKDLKALTGKLNPSYEEILTSVCIESNNTVIKSLKLDNVKAKILEQKIGSEEAIKTLNRLLRESIAEMPEVRVLVKLNRREFTDLISNHSKGSAIHSVIYENYQEKKISSLLREKMEKSCGNISEEIKKLAELREEGILKVVQGKLQITEDKSNDHVMAKIVNASINDYYQNQKDLVLDRVLTSNLININCEVGKTANPHDLSLSIMNKSINGIFDRNNSLAMLKNFDISNSRFESMGSFACNHKELYSDMMNSVETFNQKWREDHCTTKNCFERKKIASAEKQKIANSSQDSSGNAIKSSVEGNTGGTQSLGMARTRVYNEVAQPDINTTKKLVNNYQNKAVKNNKKIEHSDNSEIKSYKTQERVTSQVVSRGKNAHKNRDTSSTGEAINGTLNNNSGKAMTIVPSRNIAGNRSNNVSHNALYNEPTPNLARFANAQVASLDAGKKAALFRLAGSNLDYIEKHNMITIEIDSNHIKNFQNGNIDALDDIDKALIKEAIRGGLDIEIKSSEMTILIKPDDKLYLSLKEKINNVSSNETKILGEIKLNKDRVFYLEMIKSSRILLEN